MWLRPTLLAVTNITIMASVWACSCPNVMYIQYVRGWVSPHQLDARC